MIVDTSALLAIALREPERDTFYVLLLRAKRRRMSAASYVEAAEVYMRRTSVSTGIALLNRDLAQLRIEIVAVTAEQAYAAAEARRTYGKGRHDADLNYGDSFTYALAKSLDEPLLFKGNDFIHTDVKRAAP
ncbi:type II toxin-antitoxin system VapC family toxin [Caulobacter sp. DWP3-1-3b2]|uniref:type II toxin-antitoxin system VapC family toxin n=1 Tax=unclassified Caulobacter TaxID=2648921 RepID=UPI0019B06C8B|nr:type II toxin-antitoxin system VapC family toxin [Caulobacter sp.]